MKALAIIITAVSLATLANAHSGRTDKNGGHYDRKTGTYHKHMFDTCHSGRLDSNGGHYDRKTGTYHRHR
ncbi:YHYH domain-containing protein [Akkermansia muciniphila]|uniref:YHYH domain-containing protein n=1 Tax=Akkermansia muciniphila TaxID=239935 RepID=UPI001C3783F9|nr:YHYH domain-containing protein [Akkermansia muciniphila]